ncbi:uncharacterized protein IL334_007241 [Kwoniella shivajii]|uniref:t-SNARE coiled-coil homology domain-containing protein n=1 Tax=Kwoniella shivajii TaxID=564305 RepID=A0ABZ1D8X1_9TREE|nr:hypothetical protein IL334_007241 [Kwoniella shivajii]
MSATISSISVRLNSTSSLLLERSRIISLNLKPSPSSTSQIIRNLTSIRADLGQLELENKGFRVGGGGGGGGGGNANASANGKGKNNRGENDELNELGERYDRLLEMMSEDDVGKEKVKDLRREERRSPSPSPSPSLSSKGKRPLDPIIISPQSEVPQLNVEPPTPGIEKSNLKPFKDYPDGSDLDNEEREAGIDPNDMLDHQQMMMDDQDERLNLLSHSIGRQNHLSVQIGSELDLHHQLLEDTDTAMDRTSANLHRARRRLDKVADEAKQHGSTITIVVLIFILLILIIVFKT